MLGDGAKALLIMLLPIGLSAPAATKCNETVGKKKDNPIHEVVQKSSCAMGIIVTNNNVHRSASEVVFV